MATVSFTRDEVILALDVLYFSGEKHLNEKSQAIAELCALLHDLPIFPIATRPVIFRNQSGVSNQLQQFRRSCETGNKNPNVGNMFYDVAIEFENRREELHQIALAIKYNIPYFNSEFGDQNESCGFPEGALLSHLYRLIERRDGVRVKKSERCAVCQIEPAQIYPSCGELLENHLVISPTFIRGDKRYSANDFITVCPNCHAALHRYRPWLKKEDCGAVLR